MSHSGSRRPTPARPGTEIARLSRLCDALEARLNELSREHAALQAKHAATAAAAASLAGTAEAAAREFEAFRHAIAHDLRAPMRTITGFSDILLQEHAEGLDPEGRDYLARVNSAARRADDMINGILALARSERVELARGAVDLADYARNHLARLAKQSRRDDTETVVPASLPVRAASALAQTALAELLENAWKFTSRTEQARIEIVADASPGANALTVHDNGVGFDMAYAGRLFRPFARLHAVGDFPGIGMGLAIVRRIAERHGGSVRCNAIPDGGATFTVDFGRAAD